MSASIFAAVLAAVVALLVGGVSLIFAASAISSTKTLRREWESSRPAKVAAELEGLREELLAHKRLMRAELGRIWQRMPRATVHVIDDDDGGNAPHATLPSNGELDPELAAELALQRAPAASPGTRG